MGYLKKLGKGRYRIVYDLRPENGKRRQKTETLKVKNDKEAQAILARREESVQNGEFVYDDDVNVSMLFAKFMEKKKNRLSPHSFQRYEVLFRVYLCPAFGAKKVKELRQLDLIEAYAHWSSEGREGRKISGRTVLHAHNLLRGVLNWAVRLELVKRNVAALVDRDDLPKAEKPESRALTEAELQRVLEEARSPSRRARERGTLGSQPWFYPAVFFASHTGARCGEVLALRWSDLDLGTRSVTIRRSLCKTRYGMVFKEPKNGKARTITLPDGLVSVLEAHRARQAQEKRALGNAYKDGDLVFCHCDGEPITPNSFGATFYELVKRTGVTRVRLHDLRDTHASLLAKHGVPLEVISQRLGHSNIAITAERYLYIYRERDADAARAFERLMRAEAVC